MSCVIYARFSPRKNSDSCESCEVQRAYCEEFAARNGWDVSAFYEDRSVSGTVEIEDRNLHKAIGSLKKGDVLLAYRRDRLARELIIGLEIERAVSARGATVAVVDGDVFGNSDDPGVVMMKQMLMVIAEYERKIIAARTRASMIQYIRNGRRVGGKPPYGYSFDPDDQKRLVKNDAEQSIVSEIMELHRNGHSLNRIARELNPSSSRSGKWSAQVVKQIIKRVERDSSD